MKNVEPIPRTTLVNFEVSSATIVRLTLVLAALWLLVRLWPVFLVLVVALVIVGTMSPAVASLEARGLSRGLAIGIAFVLLFVAVTILLAVTVPALLAQASALIEDEPVYRARMARYLAQSALTAPIAEWLRHVKYNASGQLANGAAFALTRRALETLAYGVSVFSLALYIMIDRDRLRGGLFAIVPRSHHIRLARVMMNIETIVGAYIRGQVITCLFIAVFSFILLALCGVPNPLALSVFAGLTDVLPYIGAFLAIGPMVLAAIPQGPVVVAIILGVMILYQEIESRILVPRIYGHALRLPSAVVLLSLLAGGTLMGIPGALLALPLAATIMMLFDELRVEMPGQQEQVEDTQQRAEDARSEVEYERRTAGVPAEQAAAIAVEISDDRRKEENRPVEPPVDEAESPAK